MPVISRDVIPILDATDQELVEISQESVLSLSLLEMRAIKLFYAKEKRNPTRIELETLAQTWSEHCKHKTFRGRITIDNETIDDLLESTIMKATRELNRDWCVSVFKDNAGIIRFDEYHDIAFKVETHNHPSALEPYGGAGTGIGGVIRDILGVGLGAKPVFNTDVFCFAPPSYPVKDIPEGVMHPARIMKGVVSGVRDYGNRMGIPTISGAVCFHGDFLCNPLVYCGTCGILPQGMSEKKVLDGDLIVAIGGRTGRDGIHGATFSSLELNAESDVSAVQIGNPIEEKKFTVALLKARDEGLYRCVTDCGAGGFSSAVGEMAEDHGAEVYLEKAPLKYAGLKPWEIWVSEAQERMVLAVPPEKFDRLRQIFIDEDVEVTVIGKFTGTNRLKLYYRGSLEGELDLDFLHHGVPRVTLTGKWEEPDETDPSVPGPVDIDRVLRSILAMPDVASKEWIIRQYDHEVQGATVLKPLQGEHLDGPGDASAVRPVARSKKGVVISHGINVHYGRIDPYWMAAAAIEESLRNSICAGGNLDHTALLDNFCWGDPHDPVMLGGLVRACRACYDFSQAYKTPFVSGKDSLNNTFRDVKTGELRSIPPTLLISAVSVVEDITKLISFEFKKAGRLVYLVGTTERELGGSQYYQYLSLTGGRVPKVDKNRSVQTLAAVSDIIAGGYASACHDCSEGGLGVGMAEMCFGGALGAIIHLANIPAGDTDMRDDEILFSESQSRFILEVNPKNKTKVEKLLKSVPHACIGEVSSSKQLKIFGFNDKLIVNADSNELKEVWRKGIFPSL